MSSSDRLFTTNLLKSYPWQPLVKCESLIFNFSIFNKFICMTASKNSGKRSPQLLSVRLREVKYLKLTTRMSTRSVSRMPLLKSLMIRVKELSEPLGNKVVPKKTSTFFHSVPQFHSVTVLVGAKERPRHEKSTATVTLIVLVKFQSERLQ